MRVQRAPRAAPRQLGAQVDDGGEAAPRRVPMGMRPSQTRRAIATGAVAARPGARIDPGAGEIGREQQPRGEAHAAVRVLLEARRAEDRVVRATSSSDTAGQSSHSPTPPTSTASAASTSARRA